MNGTAWQTTTDDIANVLRAWGIEKIEGELERLSDRLDHNEVENAALNGDEMDEQTNYTYGEIELQLVQMGILPNTDVRHWD